MNDKLHTNLGNIIYIYDVLKKYSDVDHIKKIKFEQAVRIKEKDSDDLYTIIPQDIKMW